MKGAHPSREDSRDWRKASLKMEISIPGVNLDTEITVEVFVALYGATHQCYLDLV